ncbi:rhamnan synthesis F family protein [Lacimicrobium alkaliphilum]|uniref:Glycosyl transferase family 1 n=1 Tax=Lacimicrobium alkaliphilum TaxID=1526571 RepID=A0A0U2QNQ2_9ALTE|nr:rhamnan synthesis F family protein [Lacimicrobium alkaliphilum]ALS99243.1 glycosyl transferase family 1 [Lacimicrobium alkaliphilum]
MKKHFGRLIRGLRSRKNRLARRLERKAALRELSEAELFDADYYQQLYGEFPSELAAFEDYLHKSGFANVNPSPKFDTESYLRRYLDVYHAGSSALLHYHQKGESEEREITSAYLRWHPRDQLIAKEGDSWNKQKIAICLHIFYPDFVAKFAACLAAFPCNVDVFVAASSDEIMQDAQQRFGSVAQVNKLQIVKAPNRGRNFGPLLVEFGRQLLDYDLMCHLHSKKSLYSGREQTQWFDYLNQFLFKDLHVVSCMLRLFSDNPQLGMYYPTSFWMMPSWVNHWTCNRPFAEDFVQQWGLDISDNFVNYPVGGMFWARPKALEQLLSADFSYEDFPPEPLPNDGSWLHALERVLGLLAERNGYQQFFYYPPAGRFTTDKSYIFTGYHKPPEQLFREISNFEVVSFDLFDTLLRRRYTEPDYAKYRLGRYLSEQGLVSSPQAFVTLRNEAELDLRKANNFKGDINIEMVYQRLAELLELDDEQANGLMALEFDYDLEQIQPKDEMVNVANQLAARGRQIWIITDTYYTTAQIELMIRKVGLPVPRKLLVSSHTGLRKDTGQVWEWVRDYLQQAQLSHIHIGDNVRADAQLCGDYGLSNMHVLHPADKWQAANQPRVLNTATEIDEQEILKWGRLISNHGRYPFFGE